MSELKQKQSWFKELKVRLTQSTPWFFRTIITIGTICTAIGGGILALTIIPNIKINSFLVSCSSNLMVAGVVMMAVSKLTVVNRNALPNNQNIDEQNITDISKIDKNGPITS